MMPTHTVRQPKANLLADSMAVFFFLGGGMEERIKDELFIAHDPRRSPRMHRSGIGQGVRQAGT